MPSPKPQLDHVILLLPHKDVLNPPAWLSNYFTISPGGAHADGKTENRLVLFRDGTYLEIIAFIDDDRKLREGHWWDKPFGIVDYAFTTSSEPEFSALNARLGKTGTGVSYAEPKKGGRKRPDGVTLEWQVTFPEGVERGAVPFWCHDVSPRARRVPLSENATTHPCGALGIGGLVVEIDTGRVETLNEALAAVVDAEVPVDARHEVRTPHSVPELVEPAITVKPIADRTEKTLRLALIVQTPHRTPPPDIHQTVGDGVVRILFESS